MGIYYEKIDYMGFTWDFIWGMGFYMGKPHVIKICMEIYHTNIIWDFPYKLHRHRSCIRWAIDVKMNFCKVLRCAFENNVVSSENTRSAAADDGCRRTRISTRHRHALYCSISSLANNARMSQARADTRSDASWSECQNWPKSHGSRKRRESRLLFKAVTKNTVHVLPKCQIWVLKNVVSFNNGHEGKS